MLLMKCITLFIHLFLKIKPHKVLRYLPHKTPHYAEESNLLYPVHSHLLHVVTGTLQPPNCCNQLEGCKRTEQIEHIKRNYPQQAVEK